MVSGIRWRLISYYLAVIFLALLLTGISFISFLNHFYRSNLEDELVKQALLAAALVEESSTHGFNAEELDLLCKYLEDKVGVRLTIVNKEGTVIGDSAENPALMDNHRYRPEIDESFKYGQGSSTRYSETLEQDMLYVAVPVRLGSSEPGSEGAVRLSMSLKEVDMALLRLRLFILGALIIATLAALLLGMKLSSKIINPLKKISSAAGSIAEGNFEPPLNVTGRDELADLSLIVKEMGRSLKSKVEQVTLEKNKLNAVISSINSGIVLVDRSLRIEMINPAAEEIFDVTRQEAVGLPVQVALRYYALLDNIKEVYREGNSRDFEIYLYHPRAMTLQTFLIPVSRDRKSEDTVGVLAVFHDITSLRSVEKMRSEFVANVSHELRTPLTKIKGYAETILSREITPDQLADFLQIIDVEAGRLSILIDSLLDLSRIEGQKEIIKKEKINLNALIDETVNELVEMSRPNNAVLNTDFPHSPVWVKANPDWLKQALFNIIENSIKYGHSGVRVVIAVESCSKYAVVSIADNGPGIPAADLPHIYERFYRVDKARSRKQKGTGLGLSIVKHILEAHSASYKMESTEERGTVFRFSLPLLPSPE